MSGLIDGLAGALSGLRGLFIVLAWIVAVGFVLSGLDDLFYDACYWLRLLLRQLQRRVRHYPRLTVEKMESKEQQKVAILVPAWREQSVIRDMLANTCDTLVYHNYDVFVGVYANDPETMAEVDRAAQRHPRVHRVAGPVEGPTTKADNLNAVYAAMQEYERKSGERFEIIVIHDAEDIVHPFSLLLYNYLIPRKDMIQIPVFPRVLSIWHATHWTYADEFAENHTKDLVVRESMRAFVPSAGVGTAFSRRGADLLLNVSEHDLFDPANLTEDYEIGLRLHQEGLPGIFVQTKVTYGKDPKRQRGIKKPCEGEWIATRETFPTTFRAAVRQKSRWVVGIAMQSWALIGWPGTVPVRYSLLRDRKALVTHPLNMLAYAVFFYFLICELLQRVPGTRRDLIAITWRGSPLWYLVVTATLFMCNRLLQRGIAVGRVYGFAQAVASIPRALWSNIINFSATMRAFVIFFGTLHRRLPLAWDKTEHEAFPAEVRPVHLDTRVAAREAMSATAGRTHAIAEQLASADEGQRLAAIRMVERADGPQLLEALLLRLRDESWRVRGEAARTLGFLRLAAAAESLARACTDSEWPVRANAAKALAKLGRDGEDMLLYLLTSEDKFAREIALKTLEQTGTVEYYADVITRAGDEEAPEAAYFFSFLETHGPSRLFQAMLRRRRRDRARPTRKVEVRQ